LPKTGRGARLTSLVDPLAAAARLGRVMPGRIYRDKDADVRWLQGKRCAVIGFGSQGRAQALNLRDSGQDVVVGLYPTSKLRAIARRSGFKVLNTRDAVRRGDIIFLALPDTKMPAVFAMEVAPYLQPGETLLFAHGFAIYYRTIVPRRDVDVVMVAPKGLGPMVRREFLRGRGVPALVAVHQNPTRHAHRTALGWAKAIGSTRAGVIQTSFREETETDLFGEQAVLCGGTTALIRSGFETLVSAGYPAELAYFECLHELKFIVDLIHEEGIAGMHALISDTAKWGDLTVGPKIVDKHVRKNMAEALRKIRRGAFAREFVAEMKTRRRYRKLIKAAQQHPIELAGRRLRRLMSWKAKENNHGSRGAD
jgi:ketol-acid reductoisomerase